MTFNVFLTVMSLETKVCWESPVIHQKSVGKVLWSTKSMLGKSCDPPKFCWKSPMIHQKSVGKSPVIHQKSVGKSPVIHQKSVGKVLWSTKSLLGKSCAPPKVCWESPVIHQKSVGKVLWSTKSLLGKSCDPPKVWYYERNDTSQFPRRPESSNQARP